MKIDRLFGIMLMLINKNKVTAKEMSDYFNVSVRTIQRDIDDLTIAGVPIYADVGKNGGYQLLEDFKIDHSYFNTNEAKVLISFLQSLQESAPCMEVKSVFNKLINLDMDNTQIDNRAEDKLVVKLNPLIGIGKFKSIADKITKSRDELLKLKIEYINSDFNTSSRVIHPYTMVMMGSIWYLYGFCELRGDFRIFRLNRIVDCTILREKFERVDMPKELPWENLLGSSRDTEEIVLSIDKSLQGKILEYFDINSCRIDGERVIVSVEYPVDEWLYSMILSMIPSIRVIEPEYVRNEIINRLNMGIHINSL